MNIVMRDEEDDVDDGNFDDHNDGSDDIDNEGRDDDTGGRDTNKWW